MNAVNKHILIGIICGLAAFLISLMPAAELLDLKGYDFMHIFKSYKSVPDNIVLVAIDEPSFAEINRQWPWPRSLHAKLIDSLRNSGASVIGMDILFTEPSVPEEDRSLSDAIKKAGNVVLASDIFEIKTDKYDQRRNMEPIPAFKEFALTGIVRTPVDRDFVVRRLPSVEEGELLFSEQIARIHIKKSRTVPEDAYISYAVPPNSFTTVSYYQALDPDVFLPNDFFRNKIVLVGRMVSTSPEPEAIRTDYYATPFLFLFATKNRLMSGLEIHANIVNDFINDEFVSRLGIPGRFIFFLLFGIAGSFLQIRWRPVLSGALTVLCYCIFLASAYYIFDSHRFWVPILTSMVPFFAPYGVFGISAYVTSENKRREIRKAFSHYLSPSVLESVLSKPDEIKLGGEKVEATVMFSDIAGFTTISEILPPEDISQLLNDHLTEMTRKIVKYNGTIDKFIGDNVMAFWGAPLRDPDHALNACRAAVAMKDRVDQRKKEHKAKGLPEISVRIGLNTGMVIAGNMGSEDLFDYTVIGDPVNLASRLEGANKEFGTCILISRFVYDLVSDRVETTSLGKIKVKGKKEEVEVFELIKVQD